VAPHPPPTSTPLPVRGDPRWDWIRTIFQANQRRAGEFRFVERECPRYPHIPPHMAATHPAGPAASVLRTVIAYRLDGEKPPVQRPIEMRAFSRPCGSIIFREPVGTDAALGFQDSSSPSGIAMRSRCIHGDDALNGSRRRGRSATSPAPGRTQLPAKSAKINPASALPSTILR